MNNKKITTKWSVFAVVFIVLFFSGCSGAKEKKETKTKVDNEKITTTTKIEKSKTGLEKVCSDYCSKTSASPEVSLSECNNYCEGAIKYCKTNEDAQHTDKTTCINSYMLGKLVENNPNFKKELEEKFNSHNSK